MIEKFKKSGMNLFLRFAATGAKFFLTIFILDYISLYDYGVYGMITISLTLSLYLLGLDFYTYSSRSILNEVPEKRGAKLRDQFVFYSIAYVFLLPVFYLFFYFDRIPIEYVYWFYILLVIDHITQELYRVLNIFKEPIKASILFFLKAGVWIFALALFWFFSDETKHNLTYVFLFWFVGQILSLFYGLYCVKQMDFQIDFSKSVDWDWIKKGITVSLPFFLGTLAFKGVEFADKFMIDAYYAKVSEVLGKEMAGVYNFFSGMGNVVEMIVQAAVVVIFMPKIIESFKNNKEKFDEYIRQFAKQTIILSLLATVAIIIFVYPIAIYIDKPELIDNYYVLILLALAKVLFNISMIYHYQLYVRHKDYKIISSYFIAFALNIILNLILIPKIGILGAGVATLSSYVVVLLVKYLFAKKYIS